MINLLKKNRLINLMYHKKQDKLKIKIKVNQIILQIKIMLMKMIKIMKIN